MADDRVRWTDATIDTILSISDTSTVFQANEEYANNYAEGMRTNAGAAGLEVAVVASYTMQQPDTYAPAIGLLRDAGVNIIMAVAWTEDMLGLLRLAREAGILGTGFAWIVPDTLNAKNALTFGFMPGR